MSRPAAHGSRAAPLRAGLALAAAGALLLGAGRPASAQSSPDSADYTLAAPSGRTLTLPEGRVLRMLQRTRRLGDIVDQDPDVLYYVGSGPDVGLSDPGPAYPWNAVRVQNDSVARVAVPGNYREARRAYYNYAVLQMEEIREGVPTAGCSASVSREVEAVSAFVDGWIVTRFLYGGPAYAPLDAMAFARDAGHLPALVVAAGNSRVGGCLDAWRRSHAGEMEAYRRWRERVFPDFAPGAG